MTDRETLIALLKGNLPYHSNEVACWSAEHIGALADHLIANGVVVREWIPVTERLPEADAGDVLVVKNYRGKTYVDIGKIIEGEAYCYSDDYAIHKREHKLTHWMPLPEPPMRKGENG